MPPANDDLANAQELTGGTGFATGTTVDSTGDSPYDPLIDLEGGTNSVWYRLQLPDEWDADSKVTMTMTSEEFPSLFAFSMKPGETFPPSSSSDINHWETASASSPGVGYPQTFTVDPPPDDGILYFGVGNGGGDDAPFTFWYAARTPTNVGVGLAAYDETLEPDPLWVRLDNVSNLVRSWSVSRGRQDELTRTGTGQATIEVNDQHGALDPTNTYGAFYDLNIPGTNLDPLRQVALALFNPVLETWHTVYRGFVESFDSQVHGSQRVTSTGLSCVDLFDILGAVEVAPGAAFGQPPPTESEGDVFYEDATPGPQVRIEGALAEAGIPAVFYQINTGNVSIQETVYAPGTSILSICQDAADAEFPGVANFYVNREGVIRFTGRQPRFRPTVVDYDIDIWKAGDGAAILGDSDTAQIRGLSFSRPKEAIINAALATPQIPDADETEYQANIAAQIVTDAISISRHGVRTWSAENLLTDQGISTGNDKWEETKLFADYYVANYSDPQTRVKQIVFRSLRPEDPRAPWTWRVICEVDINDIIRLTTSNPGGGGFDAEDFFVEGITYDVQPLGGNYADVTLTLDVTPRAHYNTDPFDADPDP